MIIRILVINHNSMITVTTVSTVKLFKNNKNYLPTSIYHKTILYEDLSCYLKRLRNMNIHIHFLTYKLYYKYTLYILIYFTNTNCYSERTFSALKRIKNSHALFFNARKSGLVLWLLAIDQYITKQLTFEDIIAEFAKKKKQRVNRN